MSSGLDPNSGNFLHRALHDDSIISEKFTIFPHDIAGYAYNKERLQHIQDFINDAERIGKRAVILLGHDNDHPISHFLEGSPIVFRHSMSKNFTYKDEYIIPPKVTPFELAVKDRPKMGWSERPKIGFMGWSGIIKPIGVAPAAAEIYSSDEPTNPRGLISPLVFPTPANIGVVLRHRAISALEKDARVDSEFKVNDHYFEHHSESFKLAKRQEYIESICNTHYVLAFRGCGNYSFRLFETISAGRVPVMIDTNQHLPFEDLIPWRELGVWLTISELDKPGDLILEKHGQFTSESFQDATANIEEISRNFLTRDSVANNVKRILEGYL